MPEKDPSNWATAWQALPEPVKAALLAALIALLRILYDDKEPRPVRTALECALCGSIALGVFYGIEAMHWPSGLGVFLGAGVGLFGADQVRAWGRALAQRRVDDFGSKP